MSAATQRLAGDVEHYSDGALLYARTATMERLEELHVNIEAQQREVLSEEATLKIIRTEMQRRGFSFSPH